MGLGTHLCTGVIGKHDNFATGQLLRKSAESHNDCKNLQRHDLIVSSAAEGMHEAIRWATISVQARPIYEQNCGAMRWATARIYEEMHQWTFRRFPAALLRYVMLEHSLPPQQCLPQGWRERTIPAGRQIKVPHPLRNLILKNTANAHLDPF